MKRVSTVLAFLILITSAGCAAAQPSESDVQQETVSIALDTGPQEDEEFYIAKLYGEWATEQGTLFVLEKDGGCGFYKDKDQRGDNYYRGGHMEILHGQEALDDLGVSDADRENLRIYQDTAKVYSVKMYFHTMVSQGEDNSSKLPQDGYQQILFRLADDDFAIAVILSMDTMYELERIS